MDLVSALNADIVQEIMTQCNPLSRLLLGFTCHWHWQARKQWLQRHGDKTLLRNPSIYIWKLLDVYGTATLLDWSLTVWRARPWDIKTVNYALVANNFATAQWLLDHGCRREGFGTALTEGNMEQVIWCYDRGFRIPLSMGQSRDARVRAYPLCVQEWCRGKDIFTHVDDRHVFV